jgi:hypothetical protein
LPDGGLRKLFRSHLPRADFVGVETTTTRGLPDVNYCLDGVEGWIEMKLVRGLRVAIRPEQVGWIERRLARGGRAFLAARWKRAGVDRLVVVAGSACRLLRTERITEVPLLGCWEGGPSRWDWAEVAEVLRGTRRTPILPFDRIA